VNAVAGEQGKRRVAERDEAASPGQEGNPARAPVQSTDECSAALAICVVEVVVYFVLGSWFLGAILAMDSFAACWRTAYWFVLWLFPGVVLACAVLLACAVSFVAFFCAMLVCFVCFLRNLRENGRKNRQVLPVA
jgi:hypothetical protein